MEISRAVLGVARREATQRTPTIGPLCEETSRHDAETRQVGSRPTRATANLTKTIDPLRLRQSHLDTTRRGCGAIEPPSGRHNPNVGF